MQKHKKQPNAVRRSAVFAVSTIAVALLVVAGFEVAEHAEVKRYQRQALNLPKGFTITAHAGALHTQANTIDSIKKGLDFIGNGCIEVDVRFNGAKRPILAHDAAKSGDKEVTLQEAMDLIAKYPAHVNLDLKEITNVPEIERLATETGILDQLFFTGVSAQAAEIVKTDAPHIPYYINEGIDAAKRTDKAYLQTLANNTKRLGAIGVNLNYKDATRELVQVMHENGLLVSVWTVNTRKEMCKMLLLGVDNITTKKPDVLQKLLNVWQKG